MATPIDRFLENVKEVTRLLEIHTRIAGSSVGRKHDVEVLNKSAVVLLVACWEAFIEDLASSAFVFLLANAADHSTFPDDVLTLASRKLKAAPDNRLVWRLAGAGWRDVLEEHKSELFKEYISKLNTPKPKQVDALFASLLGISSLSSRWSWHTTTSAKACARLTALVELRGSIAHQVAADRPVRKSQVRAYVDLIHRLAIASTNRVAVHLLTRTKQRPWPIYVYKRAR